MCPRWRPVEPRLELKGPAEYSSARAAPGLLGLGRALLDSAVSPANEVQRNVPAPVLLFSVAGPAANRIQRLLHARGFEVTLDSDPSTLAAADPHGLVIVDAADTARVVALTKRVRKQVHDKLPVLAVGHGHEVEERVALLEAGADDVLGQPFDERELEALVEALLLRSAAPALADGKEVAVPAGTRTGRGQVFVFVATKGGSGATTLAVNVAVLLATRPEADVAIADLDFYHGQVALHLDLRGDVSTAQLARQQHEGATELLPAAAAVHESGLIVFAAPHRPDEGSRVTAADVRRLVDALRGEHAFVVVDAGTSIDDRTLALLQMADRVVLSVTPEIPALRTLHGLLEVLADSGTMSDRILFVLNQVFPKPMLSTDQIEENLGIKFALQVPYHKRLYVKAVNEGQPLVIADARSAPAQQMRRLTALLLGEVEADAGGRRRLFAGLRKRRQPS
jgi:pilus assembly protein CpaE